LNENIFFKEKIEGKIKKKSNYSLIIKTFDGMFGSALFSNKNSTILRPYFKMGT